MSNILRARTHPPFAWYYQWTKLNELGTADNSIETALKQPETIKVKWDRSYRSTSNNPTRAKASADIVPDKGLLGPEYALIHTIPEFESKIKNRMDPSEPDYGRTLFELFGRCLQQKASTKWNDVVANFADDKRTEENFHKALQLYLEKIADIKYLGDVLIRQLCLRSKPAVMSFDDYIARQQIGRAHV